MRQPLRAAWFLGVLVVGLWGTRCGTAADTSPGRWERDIAAFEKLDRDQPPLPGGVLFYGSSSFRLWTNVAAAFPSVRVPVVNRGFGGSQLSDLNEFLERVVVPHAPRLLLIYGGDNDIAGKKPAAQVLADFQELVERMRRVLPKTRVAFVAVKPSPVRENLLKTQQEANALVRRYARRMRRVDFIDAATPLLNAEGRPVETLFKSDRLHLNAEGYEHWRKAIGPYLKRWLD